MKKTLLSALTIALASFGFAQTNSITSNNMPNDNYDGYFFGFNGSAGANCTSELVNEGNIKSSWNAVSAKLDTSSFLASDEVTLVIDTTDGWNTSDGFVFLFTEDNCSRVQLDLSQNSTVEFNITSTSAVSNFYVALGDTSAANIADLAMFSTALEVGVNEISFDVTAWMTWNNKVVDSTNASYLLMGFREAGWGTPVIPGTYTIDYIKIGSQEGIVGLDEEEAVELSVFPNPASEFVSFGMEADEVTVYDVNGVEVLNAKGVEELNVSDLETGVYMIEAENKLGKFIKE